MLFRHLIIKKFVLINYIVDGVDVAQETERN